MWGFLRLVTTFQHALVITNVKGTLAYISPEQTGRTARGLDTRTDLYSLGVVLFEALAGRRPFLDKDPLALVYAHLAKAPPALESLVESLPSAVARIVARCLEKHPEQRYQTAKGLGADLLRALSDWTEHGQIEPFALGQKDYSPKLHIPESLVSRATESQQIIEAFERVAGGAVEVLLLGGPSGVGKTALVRSVYREIAKAGRGLLLWGKHDQLGRAVPYAALAQAFSGLLNQLAASPKPVFEAWRARLHSALGQNARVIADLVPELEWLLGALSPVPVVPTEMAYNRLKLSWIEFVRTVTDASPPLVLFLDDLQWVDSASLELLKVLLTDIGRKHLLVIAAYRDNEVEPSHPLWTLVEAVSKSGVPTPRLTVGPLSEAAVEKWLTLTLRAEPEGTRALAGALFRKTHGNPFFLGQLLLDLYRQKRMRRDLDTGAWQWDPEAVERTEATANVVELMLRLVAQLPLRTQDLLGQAACAGHSFGFVELCVLSGWSAAEIGSELWPAVQAGLVIPLDGQYRETQALSQVHLGSDLEARYRFLHDRVQQAFYERMAPEQRTKTHLVIGRRLEQVFKQQGGSDQKQLEMLRHLNLGGAALTSESERKELARLNLRGAKTAKLNGSYGLQASLVEQGQALLGQRAWEEEPELSVELALEQIEADFMLRAFEQVHRRAQELLARPLPALPRLAAQELRVRACVAAGQYAEGERLGVLALSEQGIHYPESNDACITEALQQIAKCDAWLAQHPQGIRAMSVDSSMKQMLCDALEAAMLLCAAIGSRPALAALATARNVHQAAERAALTPVTPLFIVGLAGVRAAFLGEYRGGVRWAREGEQSATNLASAFFPECSFIRGHFEPFETALERSRGHFQAAVHAATSIGSLQGASWGLLGELCFVDLWGGRPLSQVAAREEAQRDQMARAGDAWGQLSFALAASYAAFLRTSRAPRPPDQDWLSVSSRSMLAIGIGLAAELARTLEAHLFLSFGEHVRALARAEEAERFRPSLYGQPPVTDIPLWQGLSAAKCCVPTLTQEERAKLLATLGYAIERFRYFTEGCAENFGHKLRLLEAEKARLDGRTEDALLAYDDAVEQAQAQGFLHIEALAAQFCADFHLSAGRKRLAQSYLRQACDAYSRWGALALVEHLQTQHPDLLLGSAATPAIERTSTTGSTASTTDTTGSAALDVATTVRAAQTLASELDPDRVVSRLMLLVQESAGAQRAALIFSAEDKLSVVAMLSDIQVRVGLSEPLSPYHSIAHSVVHFVLRTREPLIISHVPSDVRFAKDPHLGAAKVCSLLAVPLLHQGRLSGLLYLEHQTPNAFPPARVSLLRVLASQSAIALENARLYADLQAANASLETKVKERTVALDKALKELWAEMDLAQKIQTVLLPPAQIFSQRYEFAGRMKPADQVGGDYYDAFEAGGRLWLLIGDVSGHGISAGLIMMMVQTAVRSLVQSYADAGLELWPAKLLELINRAVWSNLQLIGKGQYMTLTALCIQDQQVVYAGLHQSLLVFRRATEQVEELESQGIWLGLTDEIEGTNQDQRMDFAPGDTLLLYTDGLTEMQTSAEDRSLLELAPVIERYREACRARACSEELAQGILSLTAERVINDDISVVALRHLES